MKSRVKSWSLSCASGAFVFGLAGSAWAWDAPQSWHSPADAKDPGAGGLIGTGSKTDHSIECVHCHVDAKKEIDASFTPTPAFTLSSDKPYYSPGQTYEFTVQLTGEHLGQSGCDQYVAHTNNFAATFEDAAGNSAGLLASDTGQVQGGNCPYDAPLDLASGSTLLYRDCRVVMPHGKVAQGSTQWKFSWTAPAAGTGDVTLFAGVVDGDCVMDSLNDDVKMIKTILSDGSTLARAEPPKRPKATRPAPPRVEYAGLFLSGLTAIGLVLSRRRRP